MSTTTSTSKQNNDSPVNRKKEYSYLQKKTKRGVYKSKDNIENKKRPKNNKGCKTVIRQNKNKRNRKQSKINDYFSNSNFKDLSSDYSIFDPPHMINNYNYNEPQFFYPSYKETKSYNKIPRDVNRKKRKLEETPKLAKDKKDKNNYNNGLLSCLNLNILNSFNPFHKLSNIIFEKEKSIIKKEQYNYFINNNIFNKDEINLAMNIQKDFTKEINNITSDTDRFFKETFFFLNKGFNEIIRYNFYKCLINNGFPLTIDFNKFYDIFNSECKEQKIKIPDKMLIEFYTEYIFHLLANDNSTISKNKFISLFFFNGENIDIIKNNLNFINKIKENKNNIRCYLQNYLEENFDNIFDENDNKLNKKFPKSKAVLCRILSNIVNECDKKGYLNYKEIINNDDILFEGLKIKGNPNLNMNLRKMISLKIFGQEYSEKKFYNLIQDYTLHLFSNFKI